MSVDNAILFFTLTILLLSLNIGNTFGECISTTKCSCIMPNGESYDLAGMTGSKDEFIKTALVYDKIFYFHPCQDKILTNVTVNNKTINTDGCNTKPGITLCLYNLQDNKSTSLGTVAESKLIINSNDEPRLIIGGDKHSPVTIDLICNKESDTANELFEHTTGSSDSNYKLLLLSPHACKKPGRGLSTGSVLVIILFVFSGIYFGGGALALKLLRGATGWEMLPNQKFWFDLPSLVRDGIAFTFNGCKVVSYDQI